MPCELLFFRNNLEFALWKWYSFKLSGENVVQGTGFSP